MAPANRTANAFIDVKVRVPARLLGELVAGDYLPDWARIEGLETLKPARLPAVPDLLQLPAPDGIDWQGSLTAIIRQIVEGADTKGLTVEALIGRIVAVRSDISRDAINKTIYSLTHRDIVRRRGIRLVLVRRRIKV